ncbi:MAG: hypothetical protein PUB32_03870 [Clostridiales bacterium]|nr:hypothetical protein [Clostridiales bacterium]
MKRLRKQKGSGQGGGFAAFAICSVFLLLGAAAGSFSGSYVGGSGAGWLLERGSGFGECLAGNLLAVGAVLILGSSCIGFFLLPFLPAAAGFAAGFAMSAYLAISGSWSAAFLQCGWFVVLALPVFTVLCVCAMRASKAVLGLMISGTRFQPDTVPAFLKILMISGAASVLLAAARAALNA